MLKVTIHYFCVNSALTSRNMKAKENLKFKFITWRYIAMRSVVYVWTCYTARRRTVLLRKPYLRLPQTLKVANALPELPLRFELMTCTAENSKGSRLAMELSTLDGYLIYLNLRVQS